LSAPPPEVSLGVHRLGSERVNFYLIEDEGRVTVVDAGISGYWDQVEPALAGTGRTLDDVAAVVLTHAHSDHTGIAGKLHDRGVPVYLHAADHQLLATGKESWKREGSALSALRHPGAFGFFWHMARNGALKPPHIHDPQAILDVTFNGNSIVPANNSNWPLLNDPKINAAMAQAERTLDPVRRYQQWGALDKQLTAMAVAVPWLWEDYPTLFSPRVVPALMVDNEGAPDVSYMSVR
jgi:hypothetical protein